MNSPARRYVHVTFGLAGAIIVGIGLLNYLVDPYNQFGNNRLGVYISAERESKATEVRKYPHNALLLGNSRMAMVPADRLEGFRFFNAAFGGGTAEEAFYFLKHFAWKEEIVVLGVDPGQCDPPALQGDIFAPVTLTATLDNVLNLRTVEYSVRTISDHVRGKAASMRADGSFDASGWFMLYDHENPAYTQWQLNGLKQSWSGKTVPVPGELDFYRKIAKLLRERGIACVVVIPPLHEAVAKHLQTSPALPAYQAWRRDIGSIFPVVVDLALGPDTAATNFFKSDSVHFKPDVAVRIFNREVIPIAVQTVQKQRARPVVMDGAARWASR